MSLKIIYKQFQLPLLISIAYEIFLIKMFNALFKILKGNF